MKKNTLTLLVTILFFLKLGAQDFTSLLEKAWTNNEMLQSGEMKVEASEYALKEAKALYGPNIKFNTVYTLAAGGRNIQFPIGDLLNPVYGTLNDLTQSNNFANLDNQEINFLPNNFYDAKFKIEQPIFMPELAINKELKTGEIVLKKLDIQIQKRALGKELMLAYFQLKQAETFRQVLSTSSDLLQEAARTTESMVRNGIALPSSKIRVEAQSQQLQQQIIESENGIANAKLYLNQIIGTDTYDEIPLSELPLLESATGAMREELAQLEKASELMSIAIKKEDLFYKPKVGASLDLGSQAFNFGWSPYVLFGINLDINLYDHKRHQYRKEAAKANIAANNLQKTYVTEQLDLKVKISTNNLQSAIKQAQTFETRISAAERNFKDVNIKYKEGIAGYLELLDAESLLTNTRLQYTLARFNAWSKWAELQYDTASLKI